MKKNDLLLGHTYLLTYPILNLPPILHHMNHRILWFLGVHLEHGFVEIRIEFLSLLDGRHNLLDAKLLEALQQGRFRQLHALEKLL